jgi:molybdenum cofactor biosynthesis enzyme MoaA
MESAMKKKSDRGIPSGHIKLLLTDRCNAKCFYCHLEGQDGTTKAQERIDGAFVKKLLRHVTCEHLSISGGEPTTHPKVVEICRAAAERGVRPILDTNGRLHERVSSVLRYLGEIRFNFDSPYSKRYKKIKGFDPDGLMLSIGAAQKAGVPIALNVTALDENTTEDAFMRILGFAKEMGASLRFIERFDGTFKERNKMSIEKLFTLLGREPWYIGANAHARIFRTSNGVFSAVVDDVKVSIFRTICAAAMDCMLMDATSFEVVAFLNKENIEEGYYSHICGGELTPPEKHAGDFCQATSKLYINPAGDIKPCFLSDATVPLYDAVMSENAGAISNAIRKAVGKLGNGPCRHVEPVENERMLIGKMG